MSPPSSLPVQQQQQQDEVKNNPVASVVQASMQFVTADTVAPFVRRDVSGSDSPMQNLTWDNVLVDINNARQSTKTLRKDGFCLVSNFTQSGQQTDTIDFYNQQHVVRDYYPKCQELLRKQLGLQNNSDCIIKAFDHNVRSNRTASMQIANSPNAVVQTPLPIVHADYTHVSAPKRLQQLALPPKTNDVYREFLTTSSLLDPDIVRQAIEGKRQFCFFNIWKNIASVPVQDMPLACMQADKMKQSSLLRTFQIHYTDRIGENYFCVHDSDRQVWWYYPQMTQDEALLLKQWDSHGTSASQEEEKGNNNDDDDDDYTSTFVIHSAFKDPTSSPEAPPRESIEVRCVVIYPER